MSTVAYKCPVEFLLYQKRCEEQGQEIVVTQEAQKEGMVTIRQNLTTGKTTYAIQRWRYEEEDLPGYRH